MKGPKIFIVTDLEGAAGVNLWAQTREGDTPLKLHAMHLLTQELNAAIDGILEAAPTSDILVSDGHGSGGLLFEEVHPAARVIMKGVAERPWWENVDIEEFDMLMFVGQHAMAGVPNAPLNHTFSSKTVEYYKLNGEFIGEFGVIAGLVGEVGVKTVFLSGDDKACREAEALVPHIVTVETKVGIGVQQAIHLSAHESRRRTREGACRAIKQAVQIQPLCLKGPYELEIRLLEAVTLEHYLKSGKYQQVDERTVVRRAKTIRELRS